MAEAQTEPSTASNPSSKAAKAAARRQAAEAAKAERRAKAAEAAPAKTQTPIEDAAEGDVEEVTHADLAGSPALSDEEKTPGTPQYEHRKRLIAEQKRRKRENVATEEWLEFTPNKNSKKGGKVLKCVRMKNGNVHRSLLGFEKQCKGELAAAKKAGKLRQV